MASDKLCAICHKRKAKRYCPGIRDSICAICCGTEREVTVDCPFDCPYLRESRRYEARKPGSHGEIPFPDIEVGDSFLYEHEQFIGQVGLGILRYALENPRTTDKDLQGALEKLIKTYQTLSSGLYYESLPEDTAQVGPFRHLKQFLDQYREEERKKGSIAPLKESDVIRSLVFLYRLSTVYANGRVRGRAFIDFLRQSYPEAAVPKKEESRLIVPG